MGTILQMVFTGLFLFLGNKYFPEYVICQDMKTLIIAIVIQLIISIILGLILLAFSLLVVAFKSKPVLAVIVTFIILIMAILFNALTLFLMNKFIPGLQINGIVPYLVYGFVCAIIGNATKTKKND